MPTAPLLTKNCLSAAVRMPRICALVRNDFWQWCRQSRLHTFIALDSTWHVDRPHTITVMMTLSAANCNQVLLMRELFFCSKHFFTGENNADKAPCTFTKLAFGDVIQREKGKLRRRISFCVMPVLQFHFTAYVMCQCHTFRFILSVFVTPQTSY